MMDVTYDISIEFIHPLSSVLEESVFILGTSEDGPSLQPIRIANINDAVTLFRSGELIRGGYEALEAGAKNIYLMRISGYPAKTQIPHAHDDIDDLLRIQSHYPGDIYNNYYIEVSANKFKIFFEENGVSTEVETYDLKNKTLDDLIQDTKYAFKLRSHPIEISTDYPDVRATEINRDIYQLEMGNSQDNLDYYAKRQFLQDAYRVLRGFRIPGIIVPIGAYADYNINFAEELNEVCEMRTGDGIPTIGVLPIKGYNRKSLRDINRRHFPYLVSMAGNASIPINDISRQELALDPGEDIESYENTMESTYAGLINSLDFYVSTKNKPISNIRSFELPERFNYDFLDELNISYCTETIRKGLVVINDFTLSNNRETKNLVAIRTANYVKNIIYRTFQGEIGRSDYNLEEMSQRIEQNLSQIRTEGKIKNYKFNISAKMHEVNIDLELTPIGSISSINADMKFNVRWN